MVDLGQKFNINHIYQDEIASGEAIVTATVETFYDEIELFKRSLALSNDLKRVPIIRSMKMIPEFDANLAAHMTASSVVGISGELEIYNSKAVDADKLIGKWTFHIYNGTTECMIDFEGDDYGFKGGIMANNNLRVQGIYTTNAAVSGTALPADLIKVQYFIEIDWIPITSKEADEYIREFIFAEQDSD